MRRLLFVSCVVLLWSSLASSCGGDTRALAGADGHELDVDAACCTDGIADGEDSAPADAGGEDSAPVDACKEDSASVDAQVLDGARLDVAPVDLGTDADVGMSSCCCREGHRVSADDADDCPVGYAFAEGELCIDRGGCGGICGAPCPRGCVASEGAVGCPVDWNHDATSGFCVPADCETETWLAGECTTGLVPVRATVATADPETGEAVCPEDWERYSVAAAHTDLCFETDDLAALRGLYYTIDGGRCWARPEGLEPMDEFVLSRALAGAPVLRSPSYPGVVIVLAARTLLSRDYGSTFTALDVWDCHRGAVSPDGSSAFLLHANGEVARVSLPDGVIRERLDLNDDIANVYNVNDIVALSASRAQIGGGFRGGGYYAVAEMDFQLGASRLLGPAFEKRQNGELFAVPNEPSEALLLVVQGSGGRTLLAFDEEFGTWGTVSGAASPPFPIRYVPGFAGQLVSTRSRSLDGGISWEGLEAGTTMEQLAYLAAKDGDRLCQPDGSCDSWTYLPGSGGANVVPPSFVWYRSDDTATRYQPAMGALPFVNALLGMSIGLAPASIRALGHGRALLHMGDIFPL